MGMHNEIRSESMITNEDKSTTEDVCIFFECYLL